MRRLGRGFTLIELLLVIGVFGILAVIVLVASQSLRERAVRNKALQFSRSIHNWLTEEGVGVWSFDEGTGTTAADTSANALTLDIAGATWTDGILQSGLLFDGSSATLTAPQPLFRTVPRHLTAALWFKQTAAGTPQTLLSNGLHGDFKLSLDATSKVLVDYRASNGSWQTIDTGTPVTPGSWQHVAFMWNSQDNDARVYVNSQLRAQIQPGTELFDGNTEATIASHQGSEFFNGALDEVEVYEQSF